MQGLMYRLAELDADSAGLVRVIDYFDALVRHGADTASLLRASAQLADCVAGLEITGRSGSRDQLLRCDPGGRWSPEPAAAPSTAKDIVVDDVVVGNVWLERAGASLPLDEMLVDRMALTAAMILQPRRLLSDAEHTRNLLFPMDELAVLTSCAGLGVDPSTSVRVVASTPGSTAFLQLSKDRTPGRATGIELDGESLNLVVGSFVPSAEGIAAAVSRSMYAGISLSAPACEIHTLIGTARFARSQASDTTPIVNADDLGALILLSAGAKVDPTRVPDVVRAMDVRASEAGLELLATLRVYLRSGTLRAAADCMHLHHSSVAHRLTKLSQLVGFAVEITENRARATSMMMVLDNT